MPVRGGADRSNRDEGIACAIPEERSDRDALHSKAESPPFYEQLPVRMHKMWLLRPATVAADGPLRQCVNKKIKNQSLDDLDFGRPQSNCS